MDLYAYMYICMPFFATKLTLTETKLYCIVTNTYTTNVCTYFMYVHSSSSFYVVPSPILSAEQCY
jgi:hypothetical protein